MTSPTGAAIRDILRILAGATRASTWSSFPLPSRARAPTSASPAQIETANRFSMADVLIVGRGGGSLEDLLPFSSERVVRAIAASRIPVISAVGHETDVSLSDFAADVRAPTPSAAASSSPHRAPSSPAGAGLESEISGSIRRRLERVRMLLSQFTGENLARTVSCSCSPCYQRFDEAGTSLRARWPTPCRAKRTGSRLPPASSPPARRWTSCRGATRLSHSSARERSSCQRTRVRRGDGLKIRLARGGIRAVTEETYAGEKL